MEALREWGKNLVRLSHVLSRGRFAVVITCVTLLLAGSFSGLVRGTAADNWYHPAWDYRVGVTVDAAGYTRLAKPVEVELDFTSLLDDLDHGGALDLQSIRVIEWSGQGQVLDDEVPFQFDPAADYDARRNAQGVLIFLLTGETAADATRRYHVYFDTSGSFTPPPITPLVTLTDNVLDESFDSYQVTTDRATYYYHKLGGGFSSLVDADGLDWISWNALPGSSGSFRGIPNLVHPDNGGYFHPGTTTTTSTILHQGPLKATFYSISGDGLWEAKWEAFPGYVRMTLLRAVFNYWFQYEGTPGGVLEGEQDFVLRSNGEQNLAAAVWSGDLVGEEWAYVADPAAGRSIYLVHHTEDEIVDSYRPSNDGKMTILAFGRDLNSRHLQEVPKQFTFGLAGTTAFGEVAAVVRDAYKPLNVSLGAAQERGQPTLTPTPTLTPSPTQGPPPTATPSHVAPTATGTVLPDPSSTPTATGQTPIPSQTPTVIPNLDYHHFLPLIGK